MKQVTGKINLPETRNQVSIQLRLGGHSFSEESLSAESAEREMEFVVLTAKTLLVPSEEFAEAAADAYLRLAGMACGAGEMPVWSAPHDGIVAVMAADVDCVRMIRRKLGDRAIFTSPLFLHAHFLQPTVWLYHMEGVLYIKVFDTALRFAEAVQAETEADITYYVDRLSEEFLFSSFTVCVSGEGCRAIVKILRNYFPRVVCE